MLKTEIYIGEEQNIRAYRYFSKSINTSIKKIIFGPQWTLI